MASERMLPLFNKVVLVMEMMMMMMLNGDLAADET